jgi:hypothetical protein
MLDLKIIIGSTRPGRAADHVVPWITAMAREHGDFQRARAAGTLPPAAFRLMAARAGAGK